MEDIPETYNLETREQLRATADELRVRIIAHLSRKAMTVTQLAGALGEAPAKLHHHVRELEKVGLLKLVETWERGAFSKNIPGGGEDDQCPRNPVSRHLS